MQFNDRTLQCKDCGADFVFTAGEQEFYSEKGFTNEPQRCKNCRDAKKSAVRNREPYITVCAECGAEAKLPFKPRDNRPVYCSDCFANKRGD